MMRRSLSLAPVRRAMSTLGALALVTLGGAVACEDPIILIGDLPGSMRVFAGIPDEIGATVDSIARLTELHDPRGLALASDGTVYIADSSNGRVLAVSPGGRATVLADESSCDGDACLVEPFALDVASDGSIWIADHGAHRIFRLDPESRALELRAGTGGAGDAPDFTPALEAAINAPAGIAIASGGLVYFSERGGHRVRWIQQNGTLRTIAGNGIAGYADGSPATQARLNGPMGLEIAGVLMYVADEQNNRVREVNLSGGGIRTIAGNGIAAYAETDTIAVTAKLNRPRAVALTADRSQLFIADALNHRVRVVHLATGRISTFGGTGSVVFGGEGLDAGDTSLEEPSGLAVHSDGSLFIADTGHHVVWRTRLRF